MGLSTASLHLYGANLAQLAPLLPDSLLLREHNAPWLTLLLPESEEGGGGTLEKLAKKLTKADPEAAALLFVYFDDEMFTCSLYWGGKKAAGCLSGESWAKLGKALDVLFGDDLAGKAFRYAARCVALEEKLRLLEESVGVALLDCPEFEPRTVPRGDGTLRAVKARESALRKRPNQCVLTELPVEGWPLEWQTVIGLYNQLRSDWIHNEAADLPFEIGTDTATVPRFPDTAFHKIPSGGSDKPQKRFLTWSHTTGALKNWTVGESNPYRPLWLAGPDALVCLASVPDTILTPGGFKETTRSAVVSLRSDGSTRWRFTHQDRNVWLSYAHTTADGTIRLYSSGDSCVSRDAFLFRINGETGELLFSRIIPAAENLRDLFPVEELHGFVYISNWREIVLLDETLAETARWSCGTRKAHPDSIVGSVLCERYASDDNLCLYDLRTRACTEIKPEIPALIMAVLPDGRFLGVNIVGDRQSRLIVFDQTGRVISRHKAGPDGSFLRTCLSEDQVRLLEVRAPSGWLDTDERAAATSVHVWRLDPA